LRAAAPVLGRMIDRAALEALGIGIGSSPDGPEALGKDTARETVGIGMTEVVGRRVTAAVVVLGTVGAAAAVVHVVGRHCSTCEVVGVASTVKGVGVTVDDWGCSRWMVDLAPVDRTGHSWLAHRLQAEKGSSHCRRHRSTVVVGTDSHSVCCTDSCCSRDAWGSSHSRRVGYSTVAGSMAVGSTVADMVVGTVVDMGVSDTVCRAACRCCLVSNKVLDK